MLGSTRLTALLGAAPSPTADTAVLKAYLKALATDAGLHMFLLVPGTKEPADCRTTVARNKAIKEAAAAGLPKPTGLHMATANATHLARWLDKYRKDREQDTPVNLAMEVGRSRIVLVDVDTQAEMDTFRTMWAEMSGDPRLLHVAPTVSSPGVFDEESGQWLHKDGGHFYFTLPQGLELPASPGSITVQGKEAKSSFTIYWRDRYVLIPPSRRKEGDYWVSGTDHPIPAWLLEMVQTRGAEVELRKAERAERKANREISGDVDPIQAWGDVTPWSDILEARDWVNSGRVDSCTCEIWTRPGNPPNKKSATVHGDGCSDGRFDPDAPAIHIWSDNVEGGLAAWTQTHGKTLSRLQFVAAVDHNGDISAAMAALGIKAEGENSSHGEAVSAESLAAEFGVSSSANLASQIMEERPKNTEKSPADSQAKPQVKDVSTDGAVDPVSLFANPGDPAPEASADESEDEDEDTTEDTTEAAATEVPEGPRRPVLASFNHWRSIPAPEFIVEGWIEDRALSAMIGPSGVGKSAVVLDMVCSIAMGIPWQGKATKKSRVLYIAGEGGAGAAQRIKSWETEHNLNVGEDVFMITEAVLIGSSDKDLWNWLADQVKALEIRLVVFDTLARMSLGLEENSASDMGNAVARFDRLRRDADTGVMVVHHTARGQSHGRGSTAILGALDSEVLISEPDDDEEGGGPGKAIAATVTKQKNARDGEELLLTLCERHGSIVVADQNGHTGDPMSAKVVAFPTPAPVETDTDLAIRLSEYLAPFPMQGATKVDMVRDLLPGKEYRKNKSAWKSAIARAVDRGLATGLLATFGTDAAQRYVRGSATPAQAKALDSAEAADREVASGT